MVYHTVAYFGCLLGNLLPDVITCSMLKLAQVKNFCTITLSLHEILAKPFKIEMFARKTDSSFYNSSNILVIFVHFFVEYFYLMFKNFIY